jgi:hypothetical protein
VPATCNRGGGSERSPSVSMVAPLLQGSAPLHRSGDAVVSCDDPGRQPPPPPMAPHFLDGAWWESKSTWHRHCHPLQVTSHPPPAPSLASVSPSSSRTSHD